MKIKRFREYLYGVKFNFIWDCSSEELNSYLDKKYKYSVSGLDDASGGHFILEKKKKDGGIVIERFLWLKEFNWKINHYSTLSHELFHLVSRVLRDKGIDHSQETEECYAYYYGYWFETICSYLMKLYGRK